MHACRGGVCFPVAASWLVWAFLTSRMREQAQQAAKDYRQGLLGSSSGEELAHDKVHPLVALGQLKHLDDTCTILQQLLQACSHETQAIGAFEEKHLALQAALAVMLAVHHECPKAGPRLRACSPPTSCPARAARQHAGRKSRQVRCRHG
jgi:hypothetical protein